MPRSRPPKDPAEENPASGWAAEFRDRYPDVAAVSIDTDRDEVRCMLDIPGEPGWLAEGVFRLVAGDLILVGVAVWQYRASVARSPAVTARMLRAIPISGLYEKALRGARQWEGLYAEHGNVDAMVAVAGFAVAGARVGRPGQDDRAYLPWAVRYAEKVAGGSRSPVADLAAEHEMKRDRVRDLIHECRTRELLAPGRSGTAGGLLTAKAKQLIDEMEEQ